MEFDLFRSINKSDILREGNGMMKLYDMAVALVKPDQKVILKNKNSGNICFEGNAEQLLDYSDIDGRKITDVRIDNDVLKLVII